MFNPSHCSSSDCHIHLLTDRLVVVTVLLFSLNITFPFQNIDDSDTQLCIYFHVFVNTGYFLTLLVHLPVFLLGAQFVL